MVCRLKLTRVFVPVVVHDGRRDETILAEFTLPLAIAGATYAMRQAGILSVPIDDPSDKTPRRLHVSGRIDVVSEHVDRPHYRGTPDPLATPAAIGSPDDNDRMPF